MNRNLLIVSMAYFFICFFAKAMADSYSTGSGCFISSNEVLTAYHVVANNSDISVAVEDGEWMKATISRFDKGLDWAVLNVQGCCTAIVSVGVSSLDLGSKVYTLGYPSASILGLGLKYTDGVVSSLSGLAGDINRFQMTIPIQPGNSGGPVFDEHDSLVGIVSSTIDPDKFYAITGGALPQNLNFAVIIGRVPIEFKSGERCDLKNNKAATCFVQCRVENTHSDQVSHPATKATMPPRDKRRLDIDRFNEPSLYEWWLTPQYIANMDPSSEEAIKYKENQMIDEIKHKITGHVGIIDVGRLFSFELGKPYPELFSGKYIERTNTYGCRYDYDHPFLDFMHGYAEVTKKNGILISLHAYTDQYIIEDDEDEKKFESAVESAKSLIEEKFGIKLSAVYHGSDEKGLNNRRPPNCIAKEEICLNKQWAYTSWANYYNVNSDYDTDPHHIVSVSIYDSWRDNWQERRRHRCKCIWISLTGTAEEQFAAIEACEKEREMKRHQEALDAL